MFQSVNFKVPGQTICLFKPKILAEVIHLFICFFRYDEPVVHFVTILKICS